MSLLATYNPNTVIHWTRERLATSSLKVVSQHVPVENEVVVYDEVRMTVGKAIEEGLVKEQDYHRTCDSEIILVKIPKRSKVTVGYQEYKKVTKAVGFTPLGSNSQEKKKYHVNTAKVRDVPYELYFAAANSRSLLDSLEIKEDLSVWGWMSKQLPFELTIKPVEKFYAIVCVKLIPPIIKEDKKMFSETVLVNGKTIINVYPDKDSVGRNPLSHVTIIGNVGKSQLLVVNNDDKKKKRYVIDKPENDFLPPSVEIKSVFLITEWCGDSFHCIYTSSDGDEYSVHLQIPFNIQKKGLIRDFALWLPDSIDIVNDD